MPGITKRLDVAEIEELARLRKLVRRFDDPNLAPEELQPMLDEAGELAGRIIDRRPLEFDHPPDTPLMIRWTSSLYWTLHLRKEGEISEERYNVTLKKLLHQMEFELPIETCLYLTKNWPPVADILPLIQAVAERAAARAAGQRLN